MQRKRNKRRVACAQAEEMSYSKLFGRACMHAAGSYDALEQLGSAVRESMEE